MKADCSVDITALVPVSAAVGDDEKDTALLQEMAAKARAFLNSQKWCDEIENQYLGYGVGGVVAVFLCLISSRLEDVDSCLWVIVGDLPPAYIVTEENPTPAAALEAYIDEMMDWVSAVEQGDSTEELIPVNAPATIEYAKQLRNRLEFLRSTILPSM
jgi:hypothetical protein